MKKRYLNIIVILLFIGAAISSSYFVLDLSASAKNSHLITHEVNIIAGNSVCFQDNLTNNKNRVVKINVTHTGNPDLEGINITLYWTVWYTHGYIRGDEIVFPITLQAHEPFHFYICYYTDIRLKPDTYILETKFNICEDDDIPTVEITKPIKRSLYIKNQWVRSWWITTIIGGIDIEVDAYDEDGIDKVEFYIDKKLKSTDTNEPYAWTWDENTFGKRIIRVTACDNAGNSVSDEITVWKLF